MRSHPTSSGCSCRQGPSHSIPDLVSPFWVQKVLSEEEIDDTFKTLFSKLAGEVCQGLWGW